MYRLLCGAYRRRQNWNTGAVAKLARKASFSRDYSQLFISYTEMWTKVTNTGAVAELAKKKKFFWQLCRHSSLEPEEKVDHACVQAGTRSQYTPFDPFIIYVPVDCHNRSQLPSVMALIA